MRTPNQSRDSWYAPRCFMHPSMWIQRAWESHRTSFQAHVISQISLDMSNATVGLCVTEMSTIWPTAAQKPITVLAWKEWDGWKTILKYPNAIRKIKGMLSHRKWPKAMVTQHKKGIAKIMVVKKWLTGRFWLTNRHDAHHHSLLNLLLIFSISEMIQTLFLEARG